MFLSIKRRCCRCCCCPTTTGGIGGDEEREERGGEKGARRRRRPGRKTDRNRVTKREAHWGARRWEGGTEEGHLWAPWRSPSQAGRKREEPREERQRRYRPGHMGLHPPSLCVRSHVQRCYITRWEPSQRFPSMHGRKPLRIRMEISGKVIEETSRERLKEFLGFVPMSVARLSTLSLFTKILFLDEIFTVEAV